MSKPNLTAERLREIVDYNPETGAVTWRKYRADLIVGRQIGSDKGNGYIETSILGRRFLVHRLAWLHFYGVWPTYNIDHIDGNRKNNAIKNMRDVPQAINAQNKRGPRSDNTSGFLGVTKNHNKWMALIQVNKKVFYLGNYERPEEAHAAYLAAKRRLHPGGML